MFRVILILIKFMGYLRNNAKQHYSTIYECGTEEDVRQPTVLLTLTVLWYMQTKGGGGLFFDITIRGKRATWKVVIPAGSDFPVTGYKPNSSRITRYWISGEFVGSITTSGVEGCQSAIRIIQLPDIRQNVDSVTEQSKSLLTKPG